MDPTAIMSAMGGLKTAFEITKLMVDLNSKGEIQAKVVELQSIILEAQSAAMSARVEQTELLERVKSLKEKIAEINRWREESARYKLERVPPGVFVYTLKAGQENGEPQHWLCAACFENKHRSFLQITGQGGGVTNHKCMVCKSEFQTGVRNPLPTSYSRGSGWDA